MDARPRALHVLDRDRIRAARTLADAAAVVPGLLDRPAAIRRRVYDLLLSQLADLPRWPVVRAGCPSGAGARRDAADISPVPHSQGTDGTVGQAVVARAGRVGGCAANRLHVGHRALLRAGLHCDAVVLGEPRAAGVCPRGRAGVEARMT